MNRFTAPLTFLVSRWTKGAGVMVALGLAAASVRADFSADLQEASRPLDQGVPEIAVTRLQKLLGENLTAPQSRMVSQKLAESLIASKRPAEALPLLEDNPTTKSPAVKFWRAQALAELGRWNEALNLYQTVAAGESAFRQKAVFGCAEALRALGRSNEALRALGGLLLDKEWQSRARLRSAALFLDKLDLVNAGRMLAGIESETMPQRKERRLLRGRLEIARHRPERALAEFEPLVKKPEGVSHAVAVKALWGIAQAHLQSKSPEAGDDFLEDFIDRHPGDAALPLVFAKLDELYRAERRPVRTELERWTREPEQPRRGLALWYLARIDLRAGRRDRALQLLESLRVSKIEEPELAAGLFKLAQLQLEDRKYDQAVHTLEDARSWQPRPELDQRIDFAAAAARYDAGQFRDATVAFEKIAHSTSALRVLAAYDASLGWLQLGDRPNFVAAYEQLEKEGGDTGTRAELRLEEGLVRAAQGRNDAADTLRKFITDFPGNARVSEAWVALAELAFHSNPPHLEEARKLLTRADESKPTGAARERADYLTIWIEDAAAANGDKVIQLATRFLHRHPNSEFAPDVRMKLAEAYYQRQDFPNAQTEFELFAQQNSSSPLAEKALFFAAESSMASMAPHSLDRAIVLFDQVVQLKGDLRWAARNEQAVIERKLGKPQEALLLYDEVLKNGGNPAERREALCGKGDVFFDLSANDPANYQRAIEAYDQLAADPAVPAHWRNQALFKKGICLEKKADRDDALSAFYQVIETATPTGRLPELFWFYKAGFNAARLLENQAKWEAAASVYEKLVAARGMRSGEAKVRLNRLRLEHFLWPE